MSQSTLREQQPKTAPEDSANNGPDRVTWAGPVGIVDAINLAAPLLFLAVAATTSSDLLLLLPSEDASRHSSGIGLTQSCGRALCGLFFLFISSSAVSCCLQLLVRVTL